MLDELAVFVDPNSQSWKSQDEAVLSFNVHRCNSLRVWKSGSALSSAAVYRTTLRTPQMEYYHNSADTYGQTVTAELKRCPRYGLAAIN